ncbi:Transposable element Tcb1 transposase [Araneus ventricosus]|uniref:Transposable element Tcb1 transposase n=1 Tax=Araneus ventricosus TaxID=182803 RepID=A0A4Y2L7A3_ARAVE|nr:Transposable element Tcb1 transposase [Araneus ventricosus]
MIWIEPNQQMLTKNLCGTFKHGGGGVMVRVCMSVAGVRNLCFIEGLFMDRYMYHNILKQNVLTSAEKLSFGTTFTFHQDKHPEYTSKVFQEWCLYHVKQQLYDPPQSPDLIPIEHLWEETRRELKKYDIW